MGSCWNKPAVDTFDTEMSTLEKVDNGDILEQQWKENIKTNEEDGVSFGSFGEDLDEDQIWIEFWESFQHLRK
jgi:hypothetical protein